MAEPHVVLGRLEGARSLITQGEVMPELNRDGLVSLLAEAIEELAAYDSLRSQLREELGRLRKQANEAEANEARPGGCEADTYIKRTAREAERRLSRLLADSKEGEG